MQLLISPIPSPPYFNPLPRYQAGRKPANHAVYGFGPINPCRSSTDQTRHPGMISSARLGTPFFSLRDSCSSLFISRFCRCVGFLARRHPFLLRQAGHRTEGRINASRSRSRSPLRVRPHPPNRRSFAFWGPRQGRRTRHSLRGIPVAKRSIGRTMTEGGREIRAFSTGS
jgi:hypothetical protein